MDRQSTLVDYLRKRLDDELSPHYRTPLPGDDGRKTALVSFSFPAGRVKVDDLTKQLWERHRICVRDDFTSPNPRLGLRVSCHYSVTESDIDTLIEALKTMVDHA
jgi:selenocysteine lyase/cysteine desulfurase